MLAQNDPEHGDIRIHGIQITAPVTFEFEDCWYYRAGPGAGEEYRKFKTAYAMRPIRRVERLIPCLGDRILHPDIATPVTYHRYTLNDRSAPVGWRDLHLWRQKYPYIEGLYQA